MEHVVFFPSSDGTPAFRRLASFEEAVRLVEHLRNVEGVEQVSVHAMTEVPLAFRAYYRVEVPAAVAQVPAEPVPAPLFVAPQPTAPLAVAAEPVEALPAALQPVEPLPVALAAVPEPVAAPVALPAVAEVAASEAPSLGARRGPGPADRDGVELLAGRPAGCRAPPRAGAGAGGALSRGAATSGAAGSPGPGPRPRRQQRARPQLGQQPRVLRLTA